MDPDQQLRKEQERRMRAREKLRFRLFAALRDVALATQLFRTHYELHEPDVSVGVYAGFVEVCVALTENQLRLLPSAARATEFERFVAELRAGVARAATASDLAAPGESDAAGLTGPVDLAGVPIGYRAILRRPFDD